MLFSQNKISSRRDYAVSRFNHLLRHRLPPLHPFPRRRTNNTCELSAWNWSPKDNVKELTAASRFMCELKWCLTAFDIAFFVVVTADDVSNMQRAAGKHLNVLHYQVLGFHVMRCVIAGVDQHLTLYLIGTSICFPWACFLSSIAFRLSEATGDCCIRCFLFGLRNKSSQTSFCHFTQCRGNLHTENGNSFFHQNATLGF